MNINKENITKKLAAKIEEHIFQKLLKPLIAENKSGLTDMMDLIQKIEAVLEIYAVLCLVGGVGWLWLERIFT